MKVAIYLDAFEKDAHQLMKIYTPLFILLKIVDANRRPSEDLALGMLKDAKSDQSCSQ